MPGYPISPRPFSKAEIDAYFSGDRLVCLLCGKPYKKLGLHLLRIHGLSHEEYRELYGLPYRRGLSGEATTALHAALARKRMEEGKFRPEKYFHKAQEAIRKHGIRRQPYQDEVLRQFQKLSKSPAIPNPDEVFAQFLERMLAGERMSEIYRDPTMPGQNWFWNHRQKRPEEWARFMERLNEASFAIQARLGLGMQPRFVEEVRRLRKQGKSDHVIARETGVTSMTVHGHRRKNGIE